MRRLYLVFSCSYWSKDYDAGVTSVTQRNQNGDCDYHKMCKLAKKVEIDFDFEDNLKNINSSQK